MQNGLPIKFEHDVVCNSCGARYTCTPRPGVCHDIVCGVCGCRDERLVIITERKVIPEIADSQTISGK